MDNSDKFWSDDPSILFNTNRLTEFFVAKDQTTDEKLNSIARFGIYISILLSLYHKDPKYLSLCILTFVITFFIHSNLNSEKFDSVSEVKNVIKNETDTETTLNNPFGNASVLDIVDDPKRGPVADYTSFTEKALKEKNKVEENFGYNLYKEAGDDIYNKNNNQRQFYTNPDRGQIPNDPDGNFKNWLYGSLQDSTCKLNTYACSKNNNEDLRGYRQIFPEPSKNPSKI